MMLTVLPGCKEKNTLNVASGFKTDTMPTMATVNVSTLISDSGYVQYKIVAPIWKVYDEAEEPYWIFPQGVYLEKYDRKFKVIATVAADSAKYFKNKQLWRLDGHVEIHKKPKDLFLSQQLFWDQRKREIYSDSFIHIENATHMLEGYGFHSNEQMTEYNVHRPMGIFPVDREAMAARDSMGGAMAGGPAPVTPPVNRPPVNR